MDKVATDIGVMIPTGLVSDWDGESDIQVPGALFADDVVLLTPDVETCVKACDHIDEWSRENEMRGSSRLRLTQRLLVLLLFSSISAKQLTRMSLSVYTALNGKKLD